MAMIMVLYLDISWYKKYIVMVKAKNMTPMTIPKLSRSHVALESVEPRIEMVLW